MDVGRIILFEERKGEEELAEAPGRLLWLIALLLERLRPHSWIEMIYKHSVYGFETYKSGNVPSLCVQTTLKLGTLFTPFRSHYARRIGWLIRL